MIKIDEIMIIHSKQCAKLIIDRCKDYKVRWHFKFCLLGMLTHTCPEDGGVIAELAIDPVVRNWTFLLKRGPTIEETETR